MAKSEIYNFEDARIFGRNFSGKQGKFNPAGMRNFCLCLSPESADVLKNLGCNVKSLTPKEEDDEPQYYIPVAVSFKIKPPKIVLVTSKGKTKLGENEISVIDYADIKYIDLSINLSHWEMNGKTGVKAYLDSIYVTIEEDYFESKYYDVPDSAINVIDND